jgi:hypothetical protein
MRTHRLGEVVVTWESNEPYRCRSREVQVILHEEACAQSHHPQEIEDDLHEDDQ